MQVQPFLCCVSCASLWAQLFFKFSYYIQVCDVIKEEFFSIKTQNDAILWFQSSHLNCLHKLSSASRSPPVSSSPSNPKTHTWTNLLPFNSPTSLTPKLCHLNPHIISTAEATPNSLSPCSYKGGIVLRKLQIFMDFDIDGDVNSEVVGSSVDIEGRTDDENAIAGTSVDRALQEGLDVKVDEDFSRREIVHLEVPQAVNSSAPIDEPYVGQEFDSEAAAHAFYNAYATRVGFIIRVSKLSRSRRDGSAIGRALVCNKEGFRMPDKREKIVRQRAETRVGCRAMILVRKVSSGKWVVTKFVNEHTHPLTPGKGRKDLIYDQYPNEHDKIRELSQQLAIEKKRAATYKRHLEMIFEHIEEHNQSLSKKIQDIVNNVREMESEQQNRR